METETTEGNRQTTAKEPNKEAKEERDNTKLKATNNMTTAGA